jgi:hypothetical protein
MLVEMQKKARGKIRSETMMLDLLFEHLPR